MVAEFLNVVLVLFIWMVKQCALVNFQFLLWKEKILRQSKVFQLMLLTRFKKRGKNTTFRNVAIAKLARS